MRSHHFLFLFCFLLILACSFAAAEGGRQDSMQTLLQQFVDAVNTKDAAKIKSFVNEHCSKQLQARADRLVSVAQQGAPFKIVSSVTKSATELTAKLEDVNGIPIQVSMQAGDDARLNMVKMTMGDTVPAKDYSGWTTLPLLTDQIRSDTGCPGMAVAVQQGGTIETAVSGIREEGKADAIQPSDVFSIGSIGKPLCATIIGRLIDMGKLRWDETLAEALPDVPMKDAYKPVTIDEIMHHRGGIPEDLGMRKPEIDRIASGATDPMEIRANYARDLLSRNPIGKPNEKFAYSNGGYELLGVIAERTMKRPYEALVREMIFQPLGMDHSYTNLDKLPADHPSGHGAPDAKPGQQVQWQPTNFSGPLEYMFAPAGGGMWCSAEDLVKFGKMHMEGLNGKDGLLKAATIQRLHAGIPEDLVVESPTDFKPPYTASEDSRLYACGWGIEARPGIETMQTHNGSNGTMRAQLAIFPKAGLVVAAFVNCGGESEPSPPLQACLAIAQRYAKK